MDVSHILIDTVWVATPGDDDVFGSPTWSEPVAVKARVEEKSSLTRAPTGEEVVSRAQFVTQTEVAMGSRVWLPGKDKDDPGQAETPLNVGKASTLDGRSTLWQVWL